MTQTNINVLIDHILVSASMKTVGQSPHQIWNPYENNAAKSLKTDLLAASDHFPVSINLNL